jgi:hypothetical protein
VSVTKQVLRKISPATPLAALRSDQATFGRSTPPRKLIQTYDSEEWEAFIEEWASGLEPKYEEVRRFGGSGDRGVDVAGFKTVKGFEDTWDCFQGKHYNRSLNPATAWPEILKMFLLPVENSRYKLPEHYYFIAPRGIGTALGHLLSTPSDLRDGFLEQLRSPTSKDFRDLDDGKSAAVIALAENTDFSRFTSIEVRTLLDQHKLTPYHAARFGGGLPDRPPADPPPSSITEKEAVYIRKLVDAYTERHPDLDTLEAITQNTRLRTHFERQREAFFRAESLESFARDRVPPNTFHRLQDEVYDAVVETAEADHVDGLTRLNETLDRAISAQLTANALIQVAEPADRKGICHQLANEDRLTWAEAT